MLVISKAGKVLLCRFLSKNVFLFQSKLRVRNVSTCPPNPVRQCLWLRRCPCHKNRFQKNKANIFFKTCHCFSATRNQGRFAKLLSPPSPRLSQSRQVKSTLPDKRRLTCMQVPQEVCGHSALKTKQGRKPKAQKQTGKQKPSPKKVRPVCESWVTSIKAHLLF